MTEKEEYKFCVSNTAHWDCNRNLIISKKSKSNISQFAWV